MKRPGMFFAALLLTLRLFAQNTFETALGAAVADIAQKVPQNAAIAVPHFVIPPEVMAEQSAVLLSDYLIAELGLRLVNTGRFRVLERQRINMDRVKDSLAFDTAGDVSDESAQGIGRFLGAQYLIIGSLRRGSGQELRLYVETVRVENAQKVASHSQGINRSELSAFYSAHSWNPPQPASGSGRTITTSNTGVYVGIVSFGAEAEDLTRGAPIFLDAAGLTRINGILDNDYRRTARPGTLLFYGVHKAFAGCGRLTSITIPTSVTAIGGYAFFSCSGLTSITIPNGVAHIGSKAFSDCSSLASITVDATNTHYSAANGVLFSKDGKTLVCYPAGKTYTAYSIPTGVTVIGAYAFAGCGRLTAITIPTSVTAIGGQAFTACFRLTAITIPTSVTTIGGQAFTGCDGLSAASKDAIRQRFGDSVF